MAINFSDSTEMGTAPKMGRTAFLIYERGGSFQDIFSYTVGTGSHNRVILPINSYRDHYGILNSKSSNQFRVNVTGAYYVTSWVSGHHWNHYFPPFLYDNTTNGFAHRCNNALTGEESNIHVQPSFTQSHDSHYDVGQTYWLSTGHDYGIRYSGESSGGLGSSTNYLQGGYQLGGVQIAHDLMRVSISLMEKI